MGNTIISIFAILCVSSFASTFNTYFDVESNQTFTYIGHFDYDTGRQKCQDMGLNYPSRDHGFGINVAARLFNSNLKTQLALGAGVYNIWATRIDGVAIKPDHCPVVWNTGDSLRFMEMLCDCRYAIVCTDSGLTNQLASIDQ